MLNPRQIADDGLLSRRALMQRAALGSGWAALASLLTSADPAHGASSETGRDVRTRSPVFPAKAQRVVLLFQHGGPCQFDLFDPKPVLKQYDGKPVPGGVEVFFDKEDSGRCTPSPFSFAKHGQSGMEFSELLPRLAGCADDLCQIRSMYTVVNDHEGALRHFQTGKPRAGRPSMGSWITYALGTINQQLPPYVVLSDPTYDQIDGVRNWSSGWLPAIYQGTPLRAEGSALFNLSLPEGVDQHLQRSQLDLLDYLDRQHRRRFPHLDELDARIANNTLALTLKDSVTDALDLKQETAETRKLYGMDNPGTGTYGRRCLMARRLLESGVRFVAVFNDNIEKSPGDPWDTHFKHNERMRWVTENVDQPSAALIQDLKRRGMLQDTIVIWCGEFGRLAESQGDNGRDHNRHGFTGLVAGGGFAAGLTYGATDDFSYKVVDKPVSIGEFHATLLHQLGLHHDKLIYPHQGRDESLTDADITGVNPVTELIS